MKFDIFNAFIFSYCKEVCIIMNELIGAVFGKKKDCILPRLS